MSGHSLALAFELRDDLAEQDGERAGAVALTEDEWVERFVAEFDAEEIHEDDDGKAQP